MTGPRITATRIADVARLARVSTATVSRVMNHPDVVRAATRERVEAALRRTGFVRNAIAQSLAARRSHTVAVIIPTITNPILAGSTRGIAAVLDAHGYQLLIGTTDNSAAREVELIRTFVERRVDGLVLTGVARDEAAERLLRQGRHPHVTTWEYDRRPGRATVSFDNEAAARAMTEALLGLGHRRIGFVSGPTRINDRSRARLRGYRAALAAAGVAEDAALVHEAEFTFENGRKTMGEFLAMAPPPTAVFFVSDILAVGALLECAERDVTVPDAVSVAGFDDLDLARHVRPSLSTVRVPTYEMGRQAALLLLDIVAGRPRRKTLLPTEVVLRASTGPPR
jgi:DNA-binding LacI/PurR family transcriptional regulator